MIKCSKSRSKPTRKKISRIDQKDMNNNNTGIVVAANNNNN